MSATSGKLAVVTGASSGIGFEFARLCAKSNIDLLIAADGPEIRDAASDLMGEGIGVTPIQCDLSTRDGVKELLELMLVSHRPIDYLFANAGCGVGASGFLDQDLRDVLKVSRTNIEGSLYLLHTVGRAMRSRGCGRILVTGSLPASAPWAYQAVYGAGEAFLNAFCAAFSHELKGSGVTLTCLMPGPTDTAFFERAGILQDTRLAIGSKADAAEVALRGFDAMMKGQSGVVTGVGSPLRRAIHQLTPDALLAQINGYEAVPERRPS